MDYDIGNRLDLVLANQKALSDRLEELIGMVGALQERIFRESEKKPVEEPPKEPAKEEPEGEKEEEKHEEKQDTAPKLSKKAPKGGKWAMA